MFNDSSPKQSRVLIFDYEDLYSKCEAGDLEYVTNFFSMDSACKFDLDNLLFECVKSAIEGGQLEVLKYLDSIGARLWDTENEGFYTACSKGYLEIVKYMTENGVPQMGEDLPGYPLHPLGETCKNGHLEVVKFLIESGAEITTGVFESAVQSNNPELIKYLYSQVKDCPKFVQAGMKAIGLSKNPEIPNLLLEWKGDISEHAKTIAMSASWTNNLSALELLLKNGCRPWLTDNNECLLASSHNRTYEIIYFFLNDGVEIRYAEKFLENLIITARGRISEKEKTGLLGVFRFLKKKGINLVSPRITSLALQVQNFELVLYLEKLDPNLKGIFRLNSGYLEFKFWRRWRFKVFFRRLKQIALPLYYSSGFPGYFRDRISLEKFVGELEEKNEKLP